MGSLAHFNLAGIAKLHGLKHFIETGTAQGDSLAQACQVKAFEQHPLGIGQFSHQRSTHG